MMSERWAAIPGFGGVYEISDAGVIRRTVDSAGGHRAGKVLKAQINIHGYAYHCLRDPDGKRTPRTLHRLVLESFVGPRPQGFDASHLNGNQTDNRLENLTWEPRSANILRKREHGTMVRGEKHKCSKLTAAQVVDIRDKARLGLKAREMADEYGVSSTLIYKIASRQAWQHIA